MHVPDRFRRAAALGVFFVAYAASAALAQETPFPPAEETVAPPFPPAPWEGQFAPPAPAPASPQPSPTASARLSPFTYSGTLRAYDFLRRNRVQSGAAPNREAESNGALLHGDYAVPNTRFNLGGSYFGSYPFGLNGVDPQFNPHVDNTLPGFSVSAMLEAYATYATAGMRVGIGDQIGDKPWLPASDVRLKPSAYQGIQSQFAVAPHISLGISRFIRWEGHTASTFDQSTLLTSQPAGNPAFPIHLTPGSLLVNLDYQPDARLSASLQNYTFYDIANLLYAYASYHPAPTSSSNPFLMMQYVREKQSGAAYVGAINNKTIGFEIGASVKKNATAYLAMDVAPVEYADISANSSVVAGSRFLLPIGGLMNVQNMGNGRFRTAYGGIASPYTYNYGTDPLFSTSISQGMVDNASAGTALKIGFAITNESKQLKALFSQAYYNYGTLFSSYRVTETDADCTYYFRKRTTELYRGFFVRERVADRTQPSAPFDFKYIRSQAEYDF